MTALRFSSNEIRVEYLMLNKFYKQQKTEQKTLPRISSVQLDAGALLETVRRTIWINNSCWWKPSLCVSNYASSPQSLLPLFSLSPVLPSLVRPRSRWLTLAVKTCKAGGKNDNQLKLCENIWQLQMEFIPFELNFIDWWREFRWISEFSWLFSFSVSSLAPEFFKLFSIKRNYAIIVIVVKSN